jgi:hypothetical protein
MKIVVAVIGAIVVVLCLVFGLNYFGYANFSFFAPKYAAVQNKVFHNSPAYTQGMQQQLLASEEQYVQDAGNHEKRAAMRSLIIDQFSAYHGPLTPSLKKFYAEIQTRNGLAASTQGN